jgi:hypothetical protein
LETVHQNKRNQESKEEGSTVRASGQWADVRLQFAAAPSAVTLRASDPGTTVPYGHGGYMGNAWEVFGSYLGQIIYHPD